jgi:hypothetical protein
MPRRLWCRLFGCLPHDQAPACERCGAGVYDPEFVEYGQTTLAPVRNWWADVRWWLARRFLCHRCTSCGKRLWPWSPRVHGDHCSEACFDNWIPF